jgi:hypothetical protein
LIDKSDQLSIQQLLKEIHILCKKVNTRLLDEQDLARQYTRAKHHKINEIEKYELDNLRMFHVILKKDEGDERLKEEIMEFKDKLSAELDFEKNNEGKIFKQISYIFNLIYKLIKIQKHHLSVFNNYSTMISNYGYISRSVIDEAKLLNSLLVCFKDLIDLENVEYVHHLKIYSDIDNNDFLDGIKKIAHEKPHKVIDEHDEETMRSNMEHEVPVLKEAEKYSIAMLHESGDLGSVILKKLGKEYALVTNHEDYDVHWDTIPIIRKELHLLMKYIAKKWKEYFNDFFDIKHCKLIITGLSRTADAQRVLNEISRFATKPEFSSHVRGLAFDIGMRSIVKEIAYELEKTENSSELEIDEIYSQVKKLLEKTVLEIQEKVDGKNNINFIFESNGCFHVSINPNPKAIESVLRKLSKPNS